MWVKMTIEEAELFIKPEEDMKIDGLNIDRRKNIREYLQFRIIGGFVYVYKAFFDKNGNRDMRDRTPEQIQAEQDKWDEYILNYGWEEVENIPEQEII